MSEITQDMSYVVTGITWAFQATTEQPTFLGLYGYRMNWSPVLLSRLLKIAALQTLVFKFASAIGVIVIWGVHQRTIYRPINAAWTAMVFIICIGLMATQFWGTWVTWKIGVRVLSRQHESSNGKVSESNGSSSTDITVRPETPGLTLTNSRASTPVGEKSRHGLGKEADSASV